jgi:hypothetical protein|tara:strand:- start:72 stop:548 length:477 start_codon:yes stop_codon:yes gene_type:complete
MTDNATINIESHKLFILGADLLASGFIQQKPEDAKKLFKQLKRGEKIDVGTLNSEVTGGVIALKLDLERSQYRGQFNYPNFETSLKALLQKFATELRKDNELKDLRTLTNDQSGGVLFNLPSGVQVGDDINVLMMAVEPTEGCLTVRLIFMEPDQFNA